MSSGTTQVVGVKYTAKDYILTTISRLKNPNSFNVWYNDGENVLAGVSSAYLARFGITRAIESVRCCVITKGIEKTVFMATKPSDKTGAMLSETVTTRINSGDSAEENTFFTTGVEYNSYMKPIVATDEDGIVTEYTYNDFGEVLTEKVYPSSQPTLNTLVTREYSGGNLSAVKEKRLTTEYTHAFAYNADDTLNYEVTPGGQYIYRSYTADREKLSQIRATVSGGINSNDMLYSGDMLDILAHNGMSITFEYDEKNNVERVYIEDDDIISKEYVYNSNGLTQIVTTHGNGAKIKAYYDKYNRIIRVTDVTGTETEICAYIYSDEEVADSVVDPMDGSLKISASSRLYAFIDTAAGKRTNYIYDDYGNVKEAQTGNIREYVDERDRYNRITSTAFTDGTKTVQNNVVYEDINAGRVQSEQIIIDSSSTDVNYTRDELKRLAEIKVMQGNNGYKRAFAYVPRGAVASPEGTTNYIGSVSYYNVINDAETFEKTENVEYNADGHIIKYGDNTYVYDNLGRLLRENNKALDKTTVFVYNVGGNIVSKTEYAYTTGTVGAATATYTYAYGNAWKDQLTSYGGNAITYDALGNPTSYLGKTLTWSRGRLLTKYVNGTTTVDIQYDANGFRTSKTKTTKYSTTTYSYIYSDNGRLLYDRVNSFDRYYFYGINGIEGFEEDGVRYIYRKNLFGDITAIYQGTNKVAEYAYDAWGNCTITHDSNGFASRNPFRYRGYYWDDDLKMYYLITRYYDPATGRFINADNLNYLEPHSINGLNLYAYCLNNPIMCVDPSGTNGGAAVKAFDGEYDPDDDVFNGGGGGGGGSYAYSGPGSAQHNYAVRTNTATHDAQLGGYHVSGNTGATLNPGYFIVPGAVTVNDSMVVDTFNTNANVNNTTKVHGNSLNSAKTNYGYVLIDSQNNILKFGETINPTTRYSKTYLEQNDATMNILVFGSKRDIHLWQHDMNEYYYYKYGEYPPLNKRGW